MTTAPTPSEKCPHCGEINSAALPTCNLCGSILPWVQAKRAAEAAERQQLTQAAQQRQKAKQQKLKGAPVRVTKSAGQRVAKSFTRLPSYRGAEPATVTLGDSEISTGQLAAICGVVLLALASFAPLINAIFASATLFTFSPWLGSANLCGAVIAGYALFRSQYRWCYLAAILGLIGPVVLGYKLSQNGNEIINPWRLLQWGVLPLVLGPMACLVAAYFGETPVEDEEDTVSANPFGYDEATLFQNRLRQRIKEASRTQVFCRVVQADTQGMKARLQQAATATSWAQVPDELKQLLEDAENEVRQQISGDLPSTLEPVQKQKPFAWLNWGVFALAPLCLVLLFWGFHSNRVKTLEPVSFDIGTLTYRKSKADAFVTLTSALITELQEADLTYRFTPKITVSGQIQVEGALLNLKAEQKLIYDKGDDTIIIQNKSPFSGNWMEETIATSVGDDTIPELVKQYQAKIED